MADDAARVDMGPGDRHLRPACLADPTPRCGSGPTSRRGRHGFAKKDKANITQDEKKALQFAGKVFLDLSPAELTKALQVGVLVEVHCVQQAH